MKGENCKKTNQIKRKMSNAIRIYKGITSFLILKTGYYRKEILPNPDFNSLLEKWAYEDPKCVSNSYRRGGDLIKKVNLSICIPMFNEEKRILNLLKQIENQNTKFSIEVILINDGSTDNTEKIVKQYIEGKEIFRLISQDNRGLSAARNVAIDYASGEYLTFIDSDDEISEVFVETLMSVASSQDADIVKGGYFSKNNNKTYNCGIAHGYIWGKVFRASLFETIRFPEGYWFEDMIFNFLLVPLAKVIAEINVPLIYHNNTEGSLSKRQIQSRCYKSLEQLYLVMSLIKDYELLGLTNESYLHHRILHECAQLMVRRTEKLDEKTKIQVFLACNKIFSDNNMNSAEFTGLDWMFADAIERKDYNAWKMAADFADVFYKIYQ